MNRVSLRAGSGNLGFGVALLALALWGLFSDVGWIAQPFYAYAWWGYIFALDGLVARRRGHSLFTVRRQLLVPILLWSVSFWFFFELLNLRYQNWYYVGVFAARSYLDLVWGGLFGVACFATVFTGLFQTYEAITAYDVFRGVRVEPRPCPPWLSYAIQGLGATMVLLSIASPTYLAPLVWGSATFLIDPWNYRRGARSLLRDVEHGDVGLLLRVLAAGLACGLVWESLNFLAPQKWIYTVRGLEELKLFEMPLLGFLGFPALALDSVAAFALVSFLFHGNRTWEHPDDLAYGLAPRPRRTGLFMALLPLHLVLWSSVVWFGQTTSVGSLEVRLQHLRELPYRRIPTLEEMGIRRPRQLLPALDDAAVRDALGIDGDRAESLAEEIRLLTHKGIGVHHGRLLQSLGIRRVEDLVGRDPVALYEEMRLARGEQRFPALRAGMVRVWVLAAERESP